VITVNQLTVVPAASPCHRSAGVRAPTPSQEDM